MIHLPVLQPAATPASVRGVELELVEVVEVLVEVAAEPGSAAQAARRGQRLPAPRPTFRPAPQ